MTEENDKKKMNIIIPTKHYWIDIEKQNKWTIKITQTKGPRTILVPCESVRTWLIYNETWDFHYRRVVAHYQIQYKHFENVWP